MTQTFFLFSRSCWEHNPIDFEHLEHATSAYYRPEANIVRFFANPTLEHLEQSNHILQLRTERRLKIYVKGKD